MMIQIFHQLKIQSKNQSKNNNFHLSNMNKLLNQMQTNKSSIQFNSTKITTLVSIRMGIKKIKNKV